MVSAALRTSTTTGWNSSAVDEDALHLRPTAEALGNGLGDGFGIGELRAGRQLNGKQRPRGICGGQKARRQNTRACQRRNEQNQADGDGDQAVSY